jgi:hypothetical protein
MHSCGLDVHVHIYTCIYNAFSFFIVDYLAYVTVTLLLKLTIKFLTANDIPEDVLPSDSFK